MSGWRRGEERKTTLGLRVQGMRGGVGRGLEGRTPFHLTSQAFSTPWAIPKEEGGVSFLWRSSSPPVSSGFPFSSSFPPIGGQGHRQMLYPFITWTSSKKNTQTQRPGWPKPRVGGGGGRLIIGTRVEFCSSPPPHFPSCASSLEDPGGSSWGYFNYLLTRTYWYWASITAKLWWEWWQRDIADKNKQGVKKCLNDWVSDFRVHRNRIFKKVRWKKKKKKKVMLRDFPGGPVAKTVLPMQGTRVWSLVRELDPMCHN